MCIYKYLFKKTFKSNNPRDCFSENQFKPFCECKATAILLNQLCFELSQISVITTTLNTCVNSEVMAAHLKMHQRE